MSRVRFLSEAPADRPSLSVPSRKRIVQESPTWPREEAFARQSEVAAPAVASADAIEGVLAFAEKRPPRWSGR